NASDQPFPSHETMRTVKLLVPSPDRFQKQGWKDLEREAWKTLQSAIKEPKNTHRTVRFGDLFLLTAQIMLENMSMENAIASTLIKKLFPMSEDLAQLDIDFSIGNFFSDLKLDLYALNLIDIGQVGEWRLTEYGRKQ